MTDPHTQRPAARLRQVPEPLPVEPYLARFPGVEGFLRVIAEEPADDTHRLILADWLEDHGATERAELIRLQCREVSLPEWLRPVHVGLRIQRLRIDRVEEWNEDIPSNIEPHRGLFCEMVSRDPLRSSEDLVALEGLLDVHRIVWRNSVGTDWHRLLARFPLRRGLTHLDLSENPLQDVRLAFPSRVQLDDLRELVLENTGQNDLSLATLLRHLAHTSLESLDLAGNPLAAAGLDRLADSPMASGLRSLRLDSVPLGELALHALDRFHLESLELNRCRLGATVQTLLNLDAMSSIRWLDLGRNQIRPEHLVELADAENLTGLRVLSLSDNALTSTGATVLAACKHLSGLEALNVRSNGIDARGMTALASSPHLTNLTGLSIGGNKLGNGGLKALARSQSLSRLGALGLAHNQIYVGGARELAKSRTVKGLWSLHLGDNYLGDDGVRVLVESENARGLIALVLSNNGIGDAGVQAIADSPMLGSLGSLTLDANRIGPAGVRALVESPHLRKLFALNLQRNGLKADDAALVRSRWPFAEIGV